MESDSYHWSEEELVWLESMVGLHDYRTITMLHNMRFNQNQRTIKAIRTMGSRICKEEDTKYSRRQVAWMVANRNLESDEFGRRFRLRFKSNRSNRALREKLIKTCRMLVI